MTTPTFSSDFVLDDVKNNLNQVQEFINATLSEKLEELKKLTASDTVDVATLRASAAELAQMVSAQKLARDSIEQLERGHRMEERVLETGCDESVPLPEVENRAQKFAKEAAAYFNASQKSVVQAAQMVSKQPGFLTAASKFFKKLPSDPTSSVQNFWDRVAVATFGLAVLSSRVTKLPGALMEQLEQHIDRRVVAVGEVVNHWKQRASVEYQTMKTELKDIVRQAVETVDNAAATTVEGAHDIWDKAASVGSAVDTVLSESVVNPLVGQIEDFIKAARHKIFSWSASAYDVLQEHKTSFEQNYQKNLDQRKSDRQSSQPLRERIEPTFPKA